MRPSIRVLSLILISLSVTYTSNAQSDKPNIIFIFIDDLGWKDLGCYGATLAETPNIDKLASEGMKFSQAYASPVCSPTRASLISGQNSARHGVWEVTGVVDKPYARMKSPPMAMEIPEEIDTYGDILHKEGYTCAHIGKWHAGRSPGEHGFISLDSVTKIKDPALVRYAEMNEEWKIGELTAKSIEFIRDHTDKPFMLSLHHKAVHVPIRYREDLGAKYRAKIRKNGVRNVNPYYAAMTEMVDESVGVLLDEIERLGLADNSVVIFYSDNGGLIHDLISNAPLATSNLPLRGQKGGLYEGGIRVPLIIRWPGNVKAGSTCEERVMSFDLFSTFVDLGGAEVPKGQVTDGISIVPLIKQETESLDREALHWHFPTTKWTRSPAGAIIKGNYKLLEDYESGRIELYDLANDIGESINLAQVNPDIASELLTDFCKWRKEVGAEMPTLNPDFDPIREDYMGKHYWWRIYE